MRLAKSPRRDRAVAIALALLLLWAVPAWANNPVDRPDEATRPLVLGLLPFMSPIALFQRFAPLRAYLEGRTGRTIVLQTARDYPEFVRRTTQRRYDIVLTAPHFVLLALDSGHYQVQATYQDPLAALVLVRKDGAERKVADLADKLVATPPPEAIITMVGRRMLERQGLTGNRTPVYRNYPSHNAAYQAVAGGEAAAAITTINILRRVRDSASPLRILARSKNLPGLGFLTATDLDPGLQERIAEVLTNMDDGEAGRKVLRAIRYPGYRRATAAEFETLRPYLNTVGSPTVDSR
jgi:phosphonate transport system substrate-binding protein